MANSSNDCGKVSSPEEKAPDSSDNATPVRGVGWPKGKKRKKASKGSSDPHKPLSAYNLFIKENREKTKQDNPTLSFTELIRKMAQDWKSLSPQERQQYTNSADEDKERYVKEVAAYKKTEAYSNFSAKESKPLRDGINAEDGSGFDIPIFTEEFLEHNKVRESELRQLRKSNTEYEEQNAALETLIENALKSVVKLEDETLQQRCHNQALQQHLEHMRATFTKAFNNVILPGEKEGPTLSTLDDYVFRLLNLLETQSSSSAWHMRIGNIIKKLDLLG